MYRLILGFLRLLPWWGYAIIAVGLGSLVLGQYQTFQARLSAAEIAILEGPPEVRPVAAINRRLLQDPLQEMRVQGRIRADLGIGQLEGSVTKSYIVLEGWDQTGPLLAVMFVGAQAQGALPDLVATSDGQGRVIASGFRRTLDWSEVSGQLRLKGIRREVLLMEAMIGDRATALRTRASRDLPFLYVISGLAVLSGLTAVFRFGTWRSRRAMRSTRPHATPAQVAPQPAVAQAPTSPWTTGTITRAATFEDPPGDPIPQTPPFESVFPGGGSGFRFKSADEIIRDTFGSVSTLDRPKDAKPDD